MGNYLDSRRRKLGVVTLVLASGFMVLWLRSREIHDAFVLRFSNCFVSLESNRRGFSVNVARLNEQASFYLGPASRTDESSPYENGKPQNIDYHYRWKGFALIRGRAYQIGTPWMIMILPHWVTAIPPTLLSAWLLLSKPRAAKSTPTSGTQAA